MALFEWLLLILVTALMIQGLVSENRIRRLRASLEWSNMLRAGTAKMLDQQRETSVWFAQEVRRETAILWWKQFGSAWACIGRQRALDAVGVDLTHPAERPAELCPGCLFEVDPTTCHCGAEMGDQYTQHADDHLGTPMGCQCHNIPHFGDTDRYAFVAYWKDRARDAEARLRGEVWVDPPPLFVQWTDQPSDPELP